MVHIVHSLPDAPAALRTELQAFVRAFESGLELGMVGTGPVAVQPHAVPRVWLEWLGEALHVGVRSETDVLSRADEHLLRRGLLHHLDEHEFPVQQEAQALADNAQWLAGALHALRDRAAFHIDERMLTDQHEPFHVYIEFAGPVDVHLVTVLAQATHTFERLVFGMCPEPGDVFSDVGPTALVQLEPNLIQYWIDGMYAEPLDWKYRLEALLAQLDRRHPIAALRYEE